MRLHELDKQDLTNIPICIFVGPLILKFVILGMWEDLLQHV